MFRNLLAAAMVAGLALCASVSVTTPARADTAADVSAALTANPNGGDPLAGAIANLMTSSQDPVATAAAILAALGNANADQKAAVGKGLGQAAALIGLTKPDAATQITALVNEADPDVQTAYNDAVGAATGGISGPSGNAPRNIIGTTGGSYSPGGSSSPH
jgi:hypothetical protein